jgi:rhodanese-related sulfurtransferase
MTAKKMKVISVREFSRRRDEIYYRMQKEQMEMLYEEYERHEHDESMGHMNEKFGGNGTSSGPTIVTHLEMDSAIYDRPYLLLDVREERDYHKSHLLQARSFPHMLLRRDQYHPEVYKFRNKEESMIVLYCDDEMISRDAAKMMVDRGIENVFVLTGGYIEFIHKYPHRVEGQMPDLPVSPNRAPSRKCRDKRERIDAVKESLRTGDRSRLDAIDERSEAGTGTGTGTSYDRHGNPVYRDEIDGRRPYSLSTARSPEVSDRLARALNEHKQQRSQDYDDYHSRHGGGGYSSHSSSGDLNSARLREHEERHGGGGYSARGSPSRSYHSRQGRDRDHDAYSEVSTKSVAESIMSKAMSRRGKGY